MMGKKRIFNVGDVVMIKRWYLGDNISESYIIDKKYKKHGERTYNYHVSPAIKSNKATLPDMIVVTRDISRKLNIEEYGKD